MNNIPYDNHWKCAGLRALIRLCTDLGLKEASDYSAELRKLESHPQNETNQENRRTSTGSTYCTISTLLFVDSSV